jgi:hypothetical protein
MASSLETMTDDERRIRASNAAKARWHNRIDWETCDITLGMEEIAKLRAEAEKGGLILQRRASATMVRTALCYNPNCYQKGADGLPITDSTGNKIRTVIDIASGRAVGSRCRTNQQTGMMETAYACSAACYLYLGSHFTHSSAPPRDVPPVLDPTEPAMVINEAAKNIIAS